MTASASCTPAAPVQPMNETITKYETTTAYKPGKPTTEVTTVTEKAPQGYGSATTITVTKSAPPAYQTPETETGKKRRTEAIPSCPRILLTFHSHCHS